MIAHTFHAVVPSNLRSTPGGLGLRGHNGRRHCLGIGGTRRPLRSAAFVLSSHPFLIRTRGQGANRALAPRAAFVARIGSAGGVPAVDVVHAAVAPRARGGTLLLPRLSPRACGGIRGGLGEKLHGRRALCLLRRIAAFADLFGPPMVLVMMRVPLLPLVLLSSGGDDRA